MYGLTDILAILYLSIERTPKSENATGELAATG